MTEKTACRMLIGWDGVWWDVTVVCNQIGFHFRRVSLLYSPFVFLFASSFFFINFQL